MSLSGQELAVVEYLQRQWDLPLRLTSVAMGLEANGLAGRHDLRLRIGDHISSHQDIDSVVTSWGVPTLVLNEDEKLLGRHLSQLGESGRLSTSDLAHAVSMPPSDLEPGLTTLAHLALVEWELTDNGQVRYQMAPDWRRTLGPLGFNFHSVSSANGQRFNVPCAFDFLLLAATELREERLEIGDSCVHCTTRIRVVINRGRIDRVEPPDALLYRGGG